MKTAARWLATVVALLALAGCNRLGSVDSVNRGPTQTLTVTTCVSDVPEPTTVEETCGVATELAFYLLHGE